MEQHAYAKMGGSVLHHTTSGHHGVTENESELNGLLAMGGQSVDSLNQGEQRVTSCKEGYNL